MPHQTWDIFITYRSIKFLFFYGESKVTNYKYIDVTNYNGSLFSTNSTEIQNIS